MPIIDIENLIVNIETINKDIDSVYKGVIKNLTVNRHKLVSNLKFLFTLGDGLDKHILSLQTKIDNDNKDYKKFIDLYEKINVKDKNIYKEIVKLKNKPYKNIDESIKDKELLQLKKKNLNL